jgi:peptidoglycan/LPS O-acetylase OafA/YrhL
MRVRVGVAATFWRSPLSRVLLVLRAGARDLVTIPPGSVPGLDLLRTLAIVLVLSGHYYGDFASVRGEGLAIGRLPFFYFSWTGVDLFFVLSGYLIGRQLWRELLQRQTINVPAFLLRRGLRIWPFYFAFLAWTMLRAHQPLSAYASDLFFLSNYLPNHVAGGWSLSTEEQFYIFVPLLLLLANTVVGIRRQFIVIGLLLCALPLIRYLTLHGHPGITPDEYRVLVQLPFHTHSDGLLAGLLISWVSILRPGLLASLPLYRNLILPVALAVVGVVLRWLDPHLFAFSGLALIFGGMTCFVLRDRSSFTRLARARIFYVLSRLSYGMYLNHFPILGFGVPVFLRATSALSGYPSFVLGYIVALLASIIVSAATFITIESPFLQLRDRWFAAARARRGGVGLESSRSR